MVQILKTFLGAVMNTQLQNFKNKPKFTVATLKSFLKAFKNHIYIQELSKFNSMIDMVDNVQDDFKHTIFDDTKVNVVTLKNNG